MGGEAVPLLAEEKACEGEERISGWAVSRVVGEVKRVGYLAGPMVAVTLSQYFIQVISSMMVGHLGELPLASAAIATSLAGVTGFSLLVGMSCGLETLCGQAYGAKQYKKIGKYTHTAILALVLVCVPISLIWMVMGKLLIFAGQDPEVSLAAQSYAVWMIPGLFGYAIIQCLVKFLQSQSLILPMVLSSVLTLCLHIPLCWALVFKTGLGNAGAALSTSMSYWFNVAVLGLYVKYSESCKATWAPISEDAAKGIGEFLRIGLPSAGMVCVEWWSFELLILVSGYLPNPKLEASMLSISLTSMALLYNIPFGLGNAASTRVANELGAGNPEGARLAVQVVMFMAVTEALIVSASLFALRRVLGYAYSNEKAVTDYVTKMVPVLCIQVFMDCPQAVLSGVARGCGWQHIGAYVNLCAFYLFGVPTALGLSFVMHLGGAGLRIGILCGTTVQSVLLAIITSCTNWKQQANMARERIFVERLPLQNGLE